MKYIFLISFLLLTFTACSVEQDTIQPTCNIGHLSETLDINVHFIRTTDADTIRFSYINQDGIPVGGMWIDGVIDWDCIGFSLRNEPFDLTISAGGETCVLVIPSLNQ